MNLSVYEDYDALSAAACQWLVGQVEDYPTLTMIAPAGDSPRGMYALLVQYAAASRGSFDQARIVKLDEWHGLAMDDPATCEVFLQEQLIRPLSIPSERYVSFRSDCVDPLAECERVRSHLRQWRPYVCVLGLGLNGHLGLNEPASSLSKHAHQVALSESSKHHGMLEKGRHPVQHGLTLGMADIMQASQILLLVSGRRKVEVLDRLLHGDVSPQFPASFLHLHPSVACLADRAALPSGVMAS